MIDIIIFIGTHSISYKEKYVIAYWLGNQTNQTPQKSLKFIKTCIIAEIR